jgi:transposase
VLEHNFNWKSLSAMAGLAAWNFYFRLYPGSVMSPQVVEFLAALVRQIRQPLILVWNRLPAHRRAMVRDYIDKLEGRIHVECLRAYAPELNPVE